MPKSNIIFLLTELIEFLHAFGLDFIDFVNIGFHGLVVIMACPLHDDLWGNSHTKGIADKSPSSRMYPY